VPELLAAAASLDTVLQDVRISLPLFLCLTWAAQSRRQLLSAIRSLCQAFGPVFADVVVMADLLMALRQEEQSDAADCALSPLCLVVSLCLIAGSV
jgi:hypothetical protein